MGTTIGVYRIDGVLGRGAMGVVYRATDTKLNRAVAIKFLAADIGDENARWRFQQEAATTTSLNHPHIVTVHDVGEHDGRRYIVSEIVDGGTLEDWLAAPRKHGWRQTVELLVGVADAIATAHAAGVLHRDIKPGNILLDGNGYAKLADFGIAKLVEQQTAATGVGHATARGVVIGTVAYMSPEQASGLPLDSRSDVFSFGVVLYEALAGKRPFEGANDLETLKAIAHVAPPPLSPEIPEQLRNAVERALEKDPADRYQSIRELAIELKRVARRTTETAPRVALPVKGRTGAPWAIGGGIALTALAIAVPWALKLQRAPERPAEIRFEMPAPELDVGDFLAISPDGKRLAYVASNDSRRQVYIRPIGSLAGTSMPGTENADGVFWSPDGRAIAFSLKGELRRLDLDGNALRSLAPSSVVAARGTWGHSGTILFSAPPPKGSGLGALGSISAAGGTATLLTKVDPEKQEIFHGYPTLLPDDRHFLYVRQHPPPAEATLHLGSLDDPAGVELASAGTIMPSTAYNVGYYDGFALFMRNSTLIAQQLDVSARKLEGTPSTIAENVSTFSISENGVLAYRTTSATPAEPRQLVWYDRQGSRTPIAGMPPGSANPRLSLDGTHIVVDTSGGALRNADLWTIDVARSVPTRLTFDPANETAGIWSPDATQIVFATARGGPAPFVAGRLARRAANGTGDDEVLFDTGSGTEALALLDWSPDGRDILFARAEVTTFATVSEVWALPMSGERTPIPVLKTGFRIRSATISPNGAWLAYSTTESGSDQVMVQSFPDTNRGKLRISSAGGVEPRWRRDGRELYFLTPDGTMMVVAVTPDATTFRYEPPRALFETGAKLAPFPGFYYDVTPDGQRFVVNEFDRDRSGRVQESPQPPIEVIVNWRPPTSGSAAR
jgi:Tol biopolymer transport system component